MYERITLMLSRVATFKLSDLTAEDGQGITEYGIAVAFVAIALAAVLTTLGGDITKFIGKVGDALGNLPGSF
jgi:Flp pilus assembly pilin Flp